MTDLAVPAPRPAAVFAIANALTGRWRGLTMLGLAAAVGIVAAMVVALVSLITNHLHSLLFLIPFGQRLSEQTRLVDPVLALVPLLGGAMLAISILLARRFRTRPPVDPIEANAIHGGRMSFRESVIVTVQTVLSTSFGASVGLEAGYTQLSSALASHAAVRLNLRRNEIRMLVGCGAAGAIAAAFSAPFTGAFYAFELIIGVYAVGLLAPLITASLVATFVARWLGAGQTPISLFQVAPLSGTDVLPFIALGALSSGVAIAIMLTVAQIERGLSFVRIPQTWRPVLGGLVMGGLALVTPQVLSSGHGALALQLTSAGSLLAVALLFVLKFLASATSLGTGFRGGLFFASLLLGALLGKLYAGVLMVTGLAPHIDIQLAAVVGMASLASGIVGGPLTMSFLVLEATGDLNISAAVLVAAALSAFTVRELFGYSFSTWRFHLRGESIRSAHDVGRLRNLTVATMMRRDVRTVNDGMTLGEFRAAVPLGSTARVVVVEKSGRYAGIVLVADAYQPQMEEKSPDGTIGPLLKYRDRFLLPGLNVADAAQVFQRAESEELAVLDNLGNRNVVGLLTEKYLLRRYAEELDKGLKDLTG
jgi:CIC family chloride channel protein